MKNDYVVNDRIATVKLTQGKSMLIDESDLPLISPHRWRAKRVRHGRMFYAVTNVRLPDGRQTALYAHRLLMGLGFGDPREVDHVDHDGLNNTPGNLRVTDTAGNQHNRRGKRRWRDGREPASQFPGVCWEKRRGKWRARITLAGRLIHLGLYDDETEAAQAYIRAKAVRDAGETPDEVRATGRSLPVKIE